MTPLAAHKRALELVDKATGPFSLRASDEIACSLGLDKDPKWYFTAALQGNLSAVMALVEREMPEWKWNLRTERHASYPDFAAHAELMDRDWADPLAGYGVCFEGHCATPALALLAAYLKARIAEMKAEVVG